MRLHFTYLFLFFSLAVLAQEIDTLGVVSIKSNKYIYETDRLSPEFHKQKRRDVANKLPENSVAVFFSSPVRNRSNDINYEFHQDPNFFYLTGLEEPNAMIMIFKEDQNFHGTTSNELMYVQPKDSREELWNGIRLGVEGVDTILKIGNVQRNDVFADLNIDFSLYNHIFYILPGDDIRDDKENRGDLFSLVKHFKIKADTLLKKENEYKLKEIMASLRQVKTTEELTLMINAIDHTCSAQRELMKALRPGMHEYEAEALIEYVFKKSGAESPGFPSILGGGENSCTLHYVSNRGALKNGDLLVCDIGAEYHNYTADVTRTLPVNGTFSEEQTIIYNIVLEAQEAGIRACKEGNRFWDPNKEAKGVITRRLTELGIIINPKEVRRYFMHGTSHYLGLDVHDVGLYQNLKRGNVITVEPGIYIPEGSPCDPKWWNIGVRIEDDVLITGGIPEVLSSCIPKTIDVIEALMKEESKIME